MLEERGQVKLLHVSVPAGLNQRGGTFRVATRSQMDVLDWPHESALRFIATQGPPLIDKTSKALNAILAAVHAATTKPA